MTIPVETPDWVKDAVFYQIFPDRFAQSSAVPKPSGLQAWGASPHPHRYQGGDLLGVLEKLDYLSDLGVNALYFCPVFQSAANHRYHTHDYYRVDPMLGGNPALERLIEAAHARGMKVVLDGVFNHASRGFFQFNDILENGGDSAYLDWFHIQGWPLKPYSSGDAGYMGWWGNRALPKFNTDTPAVREYLWEVGEYWIRQGVDGWRLDVPNEIEDDAFWQEFRRRVKSANPDAYIVGEIWEEASHWLQGDQFDAVMNYPFTRAVLAHFGAETLREDQIKGTGYGKLTPLSSAEFAHVIGRVHDTHPLEITQVQLNLLGSHDTPRVRNIVGGDESAYRLATLFQLTYPGAPCVYYGDEIGMVGGPDPDCRRAMPWHKPETWDQGALEYTRTLIHARRQHPVLTRGTFEVPYAEGEGMVTRRSHEGQEALTLFNTAQTQLELTLPLPTPGRYRDVLEGGVLELDGTLRLTLPPRSGKLLVLEEK